MDLQRIMQWIESHPESYAYNSIHVTFLKDQVYRNGLQVSNFQEAGAGVMIEGNIRQICADRYVLYL